MMPERECWGQVVRRQQLKYQSMLSPKLVEAAEPWRLEGELVR